jgi:hypothetical protein
MKQKWPSLNQTRFNELGKEWFNKCSGIPDRPVKPGDDGRGCGEECRCTGRCLRALPSFQSPVGNDPLEV